MSEGTVNPARPFRHEAVTNSIAVTLGLVDLKRAAAFYDKITILNAEIFGKPFEETFGSDYSFLTDQGIIEVKPYRNQAGLNEGEAGFPFAAAIQSHLAATIFSSESDKKWIGEVAGNGMSRLHVALQRRLSPDLQVSPIVTANLKSDGFSDEVRLDRVPLPDDNVLEDLLPVRATATRVIFDKLPVPSRDTPWDDILRFREDAKTGLYAARLRNLLKTLGEQEDRRHAVDLVESEYADFEDRLRLFKRSARLGKVQMTLPWLDMLHGLLKAVALAKPSEMVEPFIKAEEQQIELSEAEREIRSNPYYMIEHVRSQLAW